MKQEMRNILRSEKGSVMLEFCLVLPIYLLIFGGTFLLFDLSMARLHLQEANRNLAWIQDDRFDTQGLINQKLYEKVKGYYDVRNALEEAMSNERMWGFGQFYAKYTEKRQQAKADNKKFSGKLPWGYSLDEFNENDIELYINHPWADKLGSGMGKWLDNGFMTMHTGNMELTMDKVSATYIGAVGVSSVLFPSPNQKVTYYYRRPYHHYRNRWETKIEWEEAMPLYAQAYTLTRAEYETEPGEGTETTRVNGEMLVIRRIDNDTRENARDVNHLTPLALGSETPNILFGAWPTNGLLGDISVLLGVGL